MASTRERWRRDAFMSALYDAGVKHERAARVFGHLMWGTDVRRLYSEIASLASLPEGAVILDVPCGGGLAFRGLRPERRVRYLAADLSPHMLKRARREAARLGVDGVEFVEADVEELPFEDQSFDLCIAYNSLHCFPAPARALAEVARVLRVGGELRGSTAITGAGRRQDALIRLYRRVGIFGAFVTPEELRAWLLDAGLDQIRIDRDGAVAYFSSRRAESDARLRAESG
jgi:ubiquinone/menaquinone biosynthesis C-methylase UbiE